MTLVLAAAAKSTRNVVGLINMSYDKSQTGDISNALPGYGGQQLQAITHVQGSMIVVAGPGSGKTTVITERIKYLIESAGVSPADILVITFTRAAAGEMENRFRALTCNREYPVRFGTFHSVFFWIIKTAYHMNGSNVITEDEKRNIVERLLKELSLQYDNKEDIISGVLAQISYVKCDMIDIDNYYSKDMPQDMFRTLYKRLEAELKRMGKIDFDDMLVLCHELLKEREDILERCRQIFKYILVDEFQDSNRIQYEILKMLAKPDENVFVVGDDDQSVYGFRGARPEIMQQFKKDFPSCVHVTLGDNYRCDRRITELSAALIHNNKNRFGKSLVSTSDNDGRVCVIETKDANEQNQLVLEEIRKNCAKGIAYERQAVLYRTNIQPRRLVYKLDSYNIPYTLRDAVPNIFEHFVVRNMLDYMHATAGDRSRALFLRIMNKPGRYISRDMLMEDPIDYNALKGRLRNKSYAADNLDKLIADLNIIKKLKPYPALNFIRRFVGYDKYIKEYAEYRQMDAGEFYDILDEFASMISDMTSYGELFEFVEDYSEVIRKTKESDRERKGVSLMTMHSAKGLEFDCVYIIDAVEGITPYKKAKTPAELEEERRMFYVAMTRARHELMIYTPKLVAGKAKSKSRYIAESGL